MADFSRFGDKIELIAPGQNIYTTYIDNTGYTCRNGTAYSATFVAGAAALVRSADLSRFEEAASVPLSIDRFDLAPAGYFAVNRLPNHTFNFMNYLQYGEPLACGQVQNQVLVL